MEDLFLGTFRHSATGREGLWKDERGKKDNSVETAGENTAATPWMEHGQHIRPPTHNTAQSEGD